MKQKAVMIALLLIVPFVISGCSSGWKVTSLKRYLMLRQGDSPAECYKYFPPTIGSINNAKDIQYCYTSWRPLLFHYFSVSLLIVYEDAAYENERASVVDKYGAYDIQTQGSFTIYSFSDPTGIKEYEAVGYSDEKKAVCYLYYFAIDLDTREDNFLPSYFPLINWG